MEKSRVGHETFEHPADMGVRGWGRTVEEAFQETAAAMFSIMGKTEKRTGGRTIDINCRGGSLEELLVDFLNDLISGADINSLFLYRVEVENIEKREEYELIGKACGIPIRSHGIDFNTEVKAASYFGVSVEQADKDGWMAQCVVDL